MSSAVFSFIVDNRTALLRNLLISLLSVITVVGLGSVLLTAWFGVPMGDDYLAIKTFSNKHTWVTESWHSLTNTGRYMQSITASFTYGLFRDTISVALPIIVLVWTYALVVLYLRLASRKLELTLPSPIIYLTAAPLLFIIVSAGSPDTINHLWFAYQAFYFSSAIVTYTIGVLLLLSFIYFTATSTWFRKQSTILQSFVVFAVIYVLGLYNETTPATIFGASITVVGIILLMPVRSIMKTRRIAILLSMAAFASLLALVSMYFSPANIARRQLLSSTGVDNSNGLIAGIVSNFSTTLSSLMLRPSDILLVFSAGLIFYLIAISYRARRQLHAHSSQILLAGVVITGIGIISILISMVLSAIGYGPSAGVLARTLLIPQILLSTGLFISSVGTVGLLYSHKIFRPARIAFMSLIVLGTLIITPHHISRSATHLSRAQDYQASWQQQDAMLRTHAQQNPQVPIRINESNAGIGDGFSLRCSMPQAKGTHWLNEGMQAYYGIREICSD